MEFSATTSFDTLPRDPVYAVPPSLKVKWLDGQYIVANPDTGGWVAVTEEILPLVFSRHSPWSEELYRCGLLLRDGVPVFRPSHPAYENLYLFEFLVTPGCNLSCVYCANNGAVGSAKYKATPEVATLFIDRVAEYVHTRRVKTSLTIEFTGGEPLLNFPVIKHTVDYARRVWARLNLPPIQFSIVTNGTLVNDKLIAFILEHGVETVGISVSIDGTAFVHNDQRPFPNKKGSFDRVVANLRRLQSAGIPVTGTVSVITSHSQTKLTSMSRSLIELGFREFLFSPVAPIGRAHGSSLEIDPGAYTENLFACLNEVLRPHFDRTGEVIPEATLAVTFAYLLSPERWYMCRRSPCGGARNIVAVMWNGNVYPCAMAPLSSPFCLGNIRDNSFDELLCSPSAQRYHGRSVDTLSPCHDCFYRSWCQSPCPRATYQCANTLDAPSYYCELMQHLYDRALGYLLRADDKTISFLKTFCLAVAEVPRSSNLETTSNRPQSSRTTRLDMGRTL